VALAVLDASVVIAFRDPADALHTRAIGALRAHASDQLALPASVYAEILVGPLRHGELAVKSLDEFVHDFGMQIAPLTAEIARRAATLRARHASLRLPDAFVLATGEALGADVVLTGDSTWKRLSSLIRVI
jgi:predicted nucleic acid-binding protein